MHNKLIIIKAKAINLQTVFLALGNRKDNASAAKNKMEIPLSIYSLGVEMTLTFWLGEEAFKIKSQNCKSLSGTHEEVGRLSIRAV